MFVKIVVILLLLIVAASLLTNRTAVAPPPGMRAKPTVRALMTRVALVLLVLGAILAVFQLAGCGREGAAFHATAVKEADFARLAALDGLTDHAGHRVVSAEFAGNAVVVFFGYTQCPDICPTVLATMQQAMRLLGPEAERVQVLFVTLDPERDTQELLAGYVPWFDARFRGLRGDAATTLAVAREFRVFFSKVPAQAGGYSIDHTATSYAYDPRGRLRLLIRHGETPEHIAADLRLLLAGQ
jgi:protein SCO1/2